MRPTPSRTPHYPRAVGLPHVAPALRLSLLLAIVAMLANLVSAGRASAAIQDWVVQGMITARSGPVFDAGCLPSGAVGTPFRIEYRVDDAAPDILPFPEIGAYPSILLWRLSFSDVNDAAMGNNGGVDVWNDNAVASSFADQYMVSFLNLQSWPAGCSATTTDLKLTLYEEAATAPAVLTSDAQPAAPLTPGDFTTTRTVTFDADGSLLEMSITDFDVLGTLAAPVIPYATTTLESGAERWHFDTECTSACWIDPPIADGFVYEASGGALFTSIDDFPTGFAAPFDVWAEGAFVGTYGPGESVDFSGYPGGGVAFFSVRGITPGADVEDVLAFPLQLSLDTNPAEFTMTSLGATPVPVLPGFGVGVLVVALGGFGVRAVRRSRG